jgi:hypothetical protein
VCARSWRSLLFLGLTHSWAGLRATSAGIFPWCVVQVIGGGRWVGCCSFPFPIFLPSLFFRTLFVYSTYLSDVRVRTTNSSIFPLIPGIFDISF